ncbi:hypothetical protein L1049_004444 [Liquidambar formosana]|uniref:PWWP domain-containing protein n=1 Tax=Liquidambar formosana TaxID=63359 RepID=A0AAP0RNG9_LIQFO
MGSSDEPSMKGIDASVGGLVWVRRRNGSWWPGRIMGLDELSEGCLVSPRSGTPVKLLGREDASVDWYNLEKSKRVKAFRCGEYDDCIEKAKASAANSNKKAVKYARREDAILHALELESARQPKDRLDFCSRTDNSGGEQHGSWARDSPPMFHPAKENDDTEEVSTFEDNSNSAQELSQSGLSFEEPNHISVPKVQSVQGRRRRTPNDSEDDGTEGIKRMRGLEDLGMGIVSKKKVQTGGVLEQVQQDSVSLCDSSIGNCMSIGSPVNGSKGHFLSLKRKRSQVANVHEFLKRKNRRRQLTKVLESTTMVSVPVMCDQLVTPGGSPLQGVSDSKVSGLESNESKRSISVVINNSSDSTGVSCENGASLNAFERTCDASHSHKLKENEISSLAGLPENDSSDRLFDVPFVGEEKHSAGFSHIFASCSSGKPQVGVLGRQSSPSSRAEIVLMRNEGLHESGSTSSAAVHNNISQRIEKGTSKWQLKGKRNSRHISKNQKQDSRNSVDVDDESDAYLAGMEHLDGFSQGSDLKVDSDTIGGTLASDSLTLHAKSKSVIEYQVDGFPDWSKHVSRREPHMRGTMVDMKLLPDCSPIPQRSLPYRQSRFTVHPKYQTADIPYRNFSPDSSLYDVNLEVKASYRPQHVPLVSLMSKLNGKAIVGHPLTVEVLDDGSCDELLSGIEWYPTSSSCGLHDIPRGNMSALEGSDMGYAIKSNPEAVRIPTKHLTLQPRFSPSKSPKIKKCGLLSKKTRKLSSLTGCHKLREDQRKPVVEKIMGPAIACIPLKVVFSRINEAVNCSTRPAHRVSTSSNP